MGCDIHGFVEYSTTSDGLFNIFAERIWLSRDYTCFPPLPVFVAIPISHHFSHLATFPRV